MARSGSREASSPHWLVGLIECFWTLLEFVLLNALAREVLRLALAELFGVRMVSAESGGDAVAAEGDVVDEDGYFDDAATFEDGAGKVRELPSALLREAAYPDWARFLLTVVSTAAAIVWIMGRFALSTQTPLRQYAARGLGLGSPRLSTLAVKVCALHAVGFAVMYGLAQAFYDGPDGRGFFSLDNYLRAGEFSYAAAVGMVLVAPAAEECLFRGVLTSIARRRFGPDNFLGKVLLPNVLFGALHLMNAFHTRYSVTYIVLQVLLGVLIGVFYSLRRAISGTLWEGFCMHAVNNVFGSFMSTRPEHFDISQPVVLFGLLETAVVYSVLVYLSLGEWREVAAKQREEQDAEEEAQRKQRKRDKKERKRRKKEKREKKSE